MLRITRNNHHHTAIADDLATKIAAEHAEIESSDVLKEVIEQEIGEIIASDWTRLRDYFTKFVDVKDINKRWTLALTALKLDLSDNWDVEEYEEGEGC